MAKKHTPKTDDVMTTISAGVTMKLRNRLYSHCDHFGLVPSHVIKDLVSDWCDGKDKVIKEALNANGELKQPVKPAREKQKGYIRSLTHQLHLPQQDLSNITMTEACKLIEDLKRADITQKPDGDQTSLF